MGLSNSIQRVIDDIKRLEKEIDSLRSMKTITNNTQTYPLHLTDGEHVCAYSFNHLYQPSKNVTQLIMDEIEEIIVKKRKEVDVLSNRITLR